MTFLQAVALPRPRKVADGWMGGIPGGRTFEEALQAGSVAQTKPQARKGVCEAERTRGGEGWQGKREEL